MRIKYIFGVLSLALLILLANNNRSFATQKEQNPHFNNGSAQCSACHTSNPPELIDGHVKTCTKCHSGSLVNHPVTRHPINVPVLINTPSPLPLTSDHRLVCSTCHDPHDTYGFASKLRVAYRTLCIQCHNGY